MIDIEKIYSESIKKLKMNETFTIALSEAEIDFLTVLFETSLNIKDWKKLKQIIFIFQFSTNKVFKLNDQLNRAASEPQLPDELAIYLLALYSKHIFIPLKLDGLMLEKSTIHSLKILGNRSSREIFEWFLRALDNLEPNNLHTFKTLIIQKKPSIFQKMKKSGRITNELVELILGKIP